MFSTHQNPLPMHFTVLQGFNNFHDSISARITQENSSKTDYKYMTDVLNMIYLIYLVVRAVATLGVLGVIVNPSQQIK